MENSSCHLVALQAHLQATMQGEQHKSLARQFAQTNESTFDTHSGLFKATFFLVMQTQADTSASLRMYEPLLGSKEVKSKYLVDNYSKVDWCNHALTDTILRRDCTRLQTILYEHISMPRTAT